MSFARCSRSSTRGEVGRDDVMPPTVVPRSTGCAGGVTAGFVPGVRAGTPALAFGLADFGSTSGTDGCPTTGPFAGATEAGTTVAGFWPGSDAGCGVSPATPPSPMQTTAAVEAAMPATFAPEPMPRSDLSAEA